MSDSNPPPTPDRLATLLEEANHEEAVAYLDWLDAADAETRKRALRAVQDIAEEPPHSFEEIADLLATFLTDEDRAVRLTTAKLFVTLAQSAPKTVLPVVDALADRLADDGEFYYVRARCAEALGYAAVEASEEVIDPGTLADLRVGLDFDEPEVREKLAKALAYLALGDPSRLRHHVDSLSEYLTDDDPLIRYHMNTALVAVAIDHPSDCNSVTDAVAARLGDDCEYVRGRAAELLGLVAAADAAAVTDNVEALDARTDDEAFVAERARFALAQTRAGTEASDDVGEIAGIVDSTADIVDDITSPDGEGCPHCGETLGSGGSPFCPACGAPLPPS